LWYDQSDITTLWTDDGSTQVSTPGDFIRRWDDKSGNAGHAYQAGATSLNDVDISNAVTAVNVVTAIDSIAESGKTITYKLSATIAAGVVSDSKTVTLTIADS